MSRGGRVVPRARRTNMTEKSKPTFEMALRAGLRRLSPDKAQAIKDAFYKAAEGLQSLADLLEHNADSVGDAEEAFIAAHLLACQGITAMNKTSLGKIL